MRNKQKANAKNLIVKKCAFCGNVFYAKRNTAIYCSDSCKVRFYLRKNTVPQWYDRNPNEGRKLPPGTITSWEMPEDKLIFRGDLNALHQILLNYLTPKQVLEEEKFFSIERPYSYTNDWCESASQIFTDNYLIEVFRIFPDEYKLYVWPWCEDSKNPFS
jgi:hypothetical protein